MKIVAINHVEDCFDGSFIKEVVFDEPLSKEFIRHLGRAGDFQYFETFARPFFKVTHGSQYEFKGVEGNLTLRLLVKTLPEQSLAGFRALVAEYSVIHEYCP